MYFIFFVRTNKSIICFFPLFFAYVYTNIQLLLLQQRIYAGGAGGTTACEHEDDTMSAVTTTRTAERALGSGLGSLVKGAGQRRTKKKDPSTQSITPAYCRKKQAEGMNGESAEN